MWIKDIFSVAPGTDITSPGTLVFCALKIAWKKKKKEKHTYEKYRMHSETISASPDIHTEKLILEKDMYKEFVLKSVDAY